MKMIIISIIKTINKKANSIISQYNNGENIRNEKWNDNIERINNE